jgi:hypothetical protein
MSIIHPLSVVQSIIHTLWTFGNTKTSLNHLDSHTYILVIRSHKKLDHADPHTPISVIWSHKHLSRPSEPIYTSLGHPDPHAPPSIMLIMHGPHSSIGSRTCRSLARHVLLSWSFGSMYTFLSRSYVPTYNIRHSYLISGTTHTHISFCHPILHTPLLHIFTLTHLSWSSGPTNNSLDHPDTHMHLSAV